MAALCLASPYPAAEVTLKAESIERNLVAALETQSFDGAVCNQVSFTDRARTFRYTPPVGWKVSATLGKATLNHEQVLARLVLASGGSSTAVASISPEELNRFQQETTTRVTGSQPASLNVLPVKVAGCTLVESSVSYLKAGRSEVLQRIRSFGGDWRLDLEITGPRDAVTRVGPDLLQSLCSLEVQTAEDLRKLAARRQMTVLAESDSLGDEPYESAGPVRGRVPRP